MLTSIYYIFSSRKPVKKLLRKITKIIKLFINLICELIIAASCKGLYFKTDEYAAQFA